MTKNASPKGTESATADDATSSSARASDPVSAEAPDLSSSGEFVAMSRRLALSAKRVIGFLPAIARTPNQDLTILEALARGLTAFVPGDVGLVHGWRASETSASIATNWVQDPENPRVIHLSVTGVADRVSAAPALRLVLGDSLPKLSRVLVDLSEYAVPGSLPGAIDLMDGVVVLVPARRARWQRVADLVRSVPVAMQLGAIVID